MEDRALLPGPLLIGGALKRAFRCRCRIIFSQNHRVHTGFAPMTAEIVNLRRVRKLKARSIKEREAERNRVQFGRTKAERAISAAEAARTARQLDGARMGGISGTLAVVPVAANEGEFIAHGNHDDEDLDPGNVS